MYKLNIKKRMTGVVEKMANLFCLCWQFGRCRLRNKHDFNYFVSNLRHQYPTEALAALSLAGNKFIEKKVILDDEYERSCFIKIGDIGIEYSFDKTIKNPNKFIQEPKWEVAKALYKLVKKSHYNSSVVYLKDHMKGKNNGRKTGLK